MSAHCKPLRSQLLHIRKTGVQLKNFTARLAVEVVVMLFPGQFVMRYFAGKLHRGQPAFLQQHLYVPIHRGDSQPAMIAGRQFQHFVGIKRPVRRLERGPDRPALPRVPRCAPVGIGSFSLRHLFLSSPSPRPARRGYFTSRRSP